MLGVRKPILVVYHADCTDGWTAAWAAWKHFDGAAEYVSASYRPTDTFDVDDREVYILDYCPSRDELIDYSHRARKLKVLDHHKSSEEKCRGLHFCTLDMNRSGAGMAWDFFHPDVRRPKLVDYVEDRDLWRWELPHSRTVSSALFSYPLGDFESWSVVADRVETKFSDILSMGEALERAENIAIAGCKQNTRKMRFAGYEDVPVVNVVGTNISSLLNQLAPANYFSVGWYQRSNGTFKYSLRSNGDFDVAALAERFGGAGHQKASGFVSSKPPWEIR